MQRARREAQRVENGRGVAREQWHVSMYRYRVMCVYQPQVATPGTPRARQRAWQYNVAVPQAKTKKMRAT